MQLEVKINLILHATENENKVLESLENVFGVEQKDFQIEQVPGHFNNPILLISSKLKKKNAENFIKVFFSKMKKDDFEEVFENVEDYVTSSGLNLRISKQKLVSENLTMSKEDAIKINISTPVYVKNNTKKIYQELMKV
ncbi:MAG: RNA-binding domain-containing protein [Thermoproteota archaeon]|jgi:RNA binding exosome subunit|nr:RNA-binding domain-containing protein [Thermoproteota archaeon]|tara:strand:+ start:205 stop:621 length:417 start_codon:yes stop_codon:yes gene_type:complete